MADNERSPRGRMAAENGTPWIGVHVLGESVFCERAGLLEYEQQVEDEGEENSLPNLEFLAEWDERTLEQQLKLWIGRAKQHSGYAVGCALALVLSANFGPWWLTLPPLAGFLYSVSLMVKSVRNVFRRSWRLRAAREAKPHEPDLESSSDQAVNWWGLLKAGFQSQPYREPLRDPRWRLAGKPWRVLRRDSIRIPVFRIRRGRSTELFRKHYARVAAYCHLMEKSEGGESPFGVILFPGTYDGVAIFNSPHSRKIFHNGLESARHFVQISESRGAVPAAPSAGRCSGCPWGKPFVDDGAHPTKSKGRELQAYCATGVDGRGYHSQCGDRYRWVPPHTKAFDKGLR
jgi:hypothetical protein